MPDDPTTSTALPPPFPLQPAGDEWVGTGHLQTALNEAVGGPRSPFRSMAIALVDLSTRSREPLLASRIDYAGLNDQEQRQADSLPKIGALFAAFRLRESVRKAAAHLWAKDASDLFQQIETAWKPIVSISVPKLPRDFPQLDRIFQVGGKPGSWDIDFKSDGLDWTQVGKLAHRVSASGSKVGFLDRLKAMIVQSDNGAAASCIRDIGFQYLNGALAKEKLFDPAHGGGLWLSWDYGGGQHGRDPSGRSVQGATACAVARFLTLVESNRLVNSSASRDMREIMRQQQTAKWFNHGLAIANPPRWSSSYYGKIGVLSLHHDCAVIERNQRGKLIRYAAVGLGAWGDTLLRNLIVRIDDCILANN